MERGPLCCQYCRGVRFEQRLRDGILWVPETLSLLLTWRFSRAKVGQVWHLAAR